MTRTKNNPKRRVLAFLVAFLFLLTYVNPMAAFADEGSNQPGETVETSLENSEESVIEETVIEEPVTEEPVTEEPVIEEPVTEEPVTEEPVIEEPVTEEPVIEEPIIEEPVTEEPVIEEPIIEEPVIEEPVIVEPIVIPEMQNVLMTPEIIQNEASVPLTDGDILSIINGDYQQPQMMSMRGMRWEWPTFNEPTASGQYDGEYVNFKITNTNNYPIYVTLVNLSSPRNYETYKIEDYSSLETRMKAEEGNEFILGWKSYIFNFGMIYVPVNYEYEVEEYQVILTKEWFYDNAKGTPIDPPSNVEWEVTAYTNEEMGYKGENGYKEWKINEGNPIETIILPKNVAFEIYEDIVYVNENEELIYYATGLGTYNELGYIDDLDDPTNDGAWTSGDENKAAITVKNYIYAGSLTIFKTFEPEGEIGVPVEFELIPIDYEIPEEAGQKPYSMGPQKVTTDNDGKAVFTNLIPGRYKLVELNNDKYDTVFNGDINEDNIIEIVKCDDKIVRVINTLKDDGNDDGNDDGDDDDDDDDDDNDDNDDNDDDNEDNDDNNNNDNDDEDDTETVEEEETPLAVPEIVENQPVITDFETIEDPQVPLAVPTVALVEVVNEATPLAAPMLPQTGGIAPELMYGLGALITAIGFRIRKK